MAMVLLLGCNQPTPVSGGQSTPPSGNSPSGANQTSVSGDPSTSQGSQGSLGVKGAGGDPKNPNAKTQVSSGSTGAAASPQGNSANYQKYFVSKKTKDTLAKDQRTFLNQSRHITKTLQSISGMVKKEYSFDWGGPKYKTFYAPVPMIGRYHPAPVFPDGGPRYAVKISADFLPNLPESIKNEISAFDLDEVDLFLVVQGGAGLKYLNDSKRVMLFAHWWGMDNPTANETNDYHRWMQMGIFECFLDISGEGKSIQMDKLGPIYVRVHDGGQAFSPETARITLSYDHLDVAFYSAVVDPQKKKAAVTLHLLLHEDSLVDRNGLSFFSTSDPRTGRSLQDVLDRFRHDAGSHSLDGNPVFSKLNQLFLIQ